MRPCQGRSRGFKSRLPLQGFQAKAETRATARAAFAFRLTIRRRSQVVRQRSAKPLSIGSIPIAASNYSPPSQRSAHLITKSQRRRTRVQLAKRAAASCVALIVPSSTVRNLHYFLVGNRLSGRESPEAMSVGTRSWMRFLLTTSGDCYRNYPVLKFKRLSVAC